MVNYRSRIPDAYDALLAICTAAFADDPTVGVHDGPFLQGGMKRKFITIGWPGFESGYQFPSRSMAEQPGSPVVNVTAEQQGMGPSIEEHFEINCAAAVLDGDTKNMAVARQATYAFMSEIGELIQPPWLNGTVQKATMNQVGELHQMQQRTGAMVIATFSVGCWAFSGQ